MLSDYWTFWFGFWQSVGGVATAITLILVASQIYYTRSQTRATEEQAEISRIEQNFTLRPWIYRDPEPAEYTSSLVYYHMFKDNLDKEKLTDEEVEEIKKEVKTKYKEI